MHTHPEIHPPDPAARRRALVLVLVAGLLAGAGLWWVMARLDAIAALAGRNDPAACAAMLRLITVLGAANLAVTAGLAFYFLRLARGVRRSGRFPPPGVGVVRPTRVRTGRAAVVTAWLLAGTALLLLSSNLLVWYLYVFAESLLFGQAS